MGYATSRVVGDVFGDVAMLRTGTSGTVRLASAGEHRAVADFEERVGAERRRACPSTSASAPAPRRGRRGGRASRRRRRRRRASWFDTTGAVGAANVERRRASATSPAVASCHQRRVERAADVERGDPAHAELLGPGRAGGRRRRACRRSRPGRARCRWRPSSRRARRCTRRRPARAWRRAARPCGPGCASAAACVSSARRAAKRTPSSRASTPDAISAVTWPSEWPANATTSSASGCERVPHDERREQHRELRFAGAGEGVGGRVGDEVRERLAERGFGALDDRPRRVVAPRQRHAGSVGFPGRGRRPRCPPCGPLRLVRSVAVVNEIRPSPRARVVTSQ